MDSEEDPSVEWEIEEIPSECSSSKLGSLPSKGWRLGKKILVTGVVISSVPFVFPPLLVFSTLGFAFSVPFGFAFASYACTEKVMSKLLSRLVAYPVSDDRSEVEREDVAGGEEEELLEDTMRNLKIGDEVIEAGKEGYIGREVEEENGKEHGGLKVMEEVPKQGTDEIGIVEEDGHGDVDRNIEGEEKSVENVKGMIEMEGKNEGKVHGSVEGEEKSMGGISEGEVEGSVDAVQEGKKLMGERKGLSAEEGEEPRGNVHFVLGRRHGEDVNTEVERTINEVSTAAKKRRVMDSIGDVGRENQVMGVVEEMKDMNGADVGVEVGKSIEEPREMVDKLGNGESIEEIVRLGQPIGGRKSIGEERGDGGNLEENGEGTEAKTSEVTIERSDFKNEDDLKVKPEPIKMVEEREIGESIAEVGELGRKRIVEKRDGGNIEENGEGPEGKTSEVTTGRRDGKIGSILEVKPELKEMAEERGNGLRIEEVSELAQPFGGRRIAEEIGDGGNLEENGKGTEAKTSEVTIERSGFKNEDKDDLEVKPEPRDMVEEREIGESIAEVGELGRKRIVEENFGGNIEENGEGTEGKTSEVTTEMVEERGNGLSIEEVAELEQPAGGRRIAEEIGDGGNLEENGKGTEGKTSEVTTERMENMGTLEIKKVEGLQYILEGKRGDENANDIVEVEKPVEELKKVMNKSTDEEANNKMKDENKSTVETKEMVQESRPVNNVAVDPKEHSGFEKEHSSSVREALLEEEMVLLNEDDVRKLDESRPARFDGGNPATEQYTPPVLKMLEALQSGRGPMGEECASMYNESADSVGRPGLSAIPKSGPAVVAAQKEIRTIPSSEISDSEEKIWEQIDSLRTIVGYKAARRKTCMEELKALYIFTGVELPASSKGTSYLVEANDKLRFLMSIVGVR